MADKTYVSELDEDQHVQATFLVEAKESRETRNGDPYLRLSLADHSGSIEARVWDDVETLSSRFDVDDFVAVRGKVDSWRDELQLVVDDLTTVDDSEVDVSEFLATSRWSREEMYDSLCDLVDRHVRGDLPRRFLEELLADAEFAEAFKRAPAATSNHHAYIGGLLEHTLSMARIAVRLCRHYEHYYPDLLNRDLVVAGVLLHDAGKIEELSYDRSVSYTTEGKLVGHIAQGIELVGAVARRLEPPPPDEFLAQLKHLVLSHHGHREYGSPVEPRTTEAVLLHEIDMIDSRMNLLHDHLEQHRSGQQSAESWTDYHRALETDVYAGPESSPDWESSSAIDLDATPGPGRSDVSDDQTEEAADAATETIDLFDADPADGSP